MMVIMMMMIMIMIIITFLTGPVFMEIKTRTMELTLLIASEFKYFNSHITTGICSFNLSFHLQPTYFEDTVAAFRPSALILGTLD